MNAHDPHFVEPRAGDDDDAPNPFDVLGLPATAGTREIEREGQRRLAMIAAGVADDSSPTAEHQIRRALDELRDARRRLAHEIHTPSLHIEDVAGSELHARVAVLAGTLPKATPSSHALAEALLWKAVEWPAPFALAPEHGDERRRAFPESRADGEAGNLTDALDWGELVAFNPPTRPPKSQKSSKQKA